MTILAVLSYLGGVLLILSGKSYRQWARDLESASAHLDSAEKEEALQVARVALNISIYAYISVVLYIPEYICWTLWLRKDNQQNRAYTVLATNYNLWLSLVFYLMALCFSGAWSTFGFLTIIMCLYFIAMNALIN